jgi:hypothetical protein
MIEKAGIAVIIVAAVLTLSGCQGSPSTEDTINQSEPKNTQGMQAVPENGAPAETGSASQERGGGRRGG